MGKVVAPAVHHVELKVQASECSIRFMTDWARVKPR